MSKTILSREEVKTLFTLDRLVFSEKIGDFSCSIPEYDAYLEQEAERSQEDRVAVTYLLHERSTGAVASYMSLIADAIKLSTSEKELHNLHYPFKTLPAMKIAKLAVSNSFKEQYSGIGSHMIDSYVKCQAKNRFFYDFS